MTFGYLVSAVIGAGAVIVGVVLTGMRETRLRTEDRDASRRAELKQAMREYLAALDAVMLEAEDFPLPPRLNRVDEWFAESVKGTIVEMLGHFIVRLLRRLIYGHRHDDLSDRLVAAAAHLRLVAPPAVEQFMSEVEVIAQARQTGDKNAKERWKEFRARMRQGFREALDNAGSVAGA